MTIYKRGCECSHSYPLCACAEGVTGDQLLRRSNRLSSLAGWPAPVHVGPAAWAIAHHLEPLSSPSGGCGCGGRA